MLPRASRLWVLLCLLLVLQLATAQSFVVVRRQDDTPESSKRPEPKQEPTITEGDDKKPAKTSDAEAKTSEATSRITSKPSTSPTPTKTTTPTVSATNTPLSNDTLFNVTIPEGQLPLHPQITPGWGVAGVILLLTGTAYTLIGIKNRWVHTFFSSAYAAALGITVLIVYVMNYPVTNGAQGGYVAGAVVAGCIVGGASTFFKEVTEGLGCALGGFCVSMWLLCLVPGGLLHSVVSKAIFISSFTVGATAFYFSRWTRDWALMTMISFAGATAVVLGMDVFSRAGLKEFWAYIWDLNENLFPLGATTYPVTKGIRVETAAIIIFFIAGVISQVKLWRIIREQKKKRAAERAEAQRNLEEEEENVGRQLEEANARERRQWERVYGDIGSSTDSRNSSGGDGLSEKTRTSQHGSAKNSSSIDVIEMGQVNNLGHKRSGSNPSMLAIRDDDGKFNVRVAADDILLPFPNTSEVFDENLEIDGTLTRDLTGNTAVNDGTELQVRSVPKAPEVVPLPFRVPVEEDVKTQSDRSSVATFADEDGADGAKHRRESTATKRFSQGSKSLLRRLSNRSRRTTQELAIVDGDSTEILIVPRQRNDDGDDGSIAATVDGESISSEDEETRSILSAGKPVDETGLAAAETASDQKLDKDLAGKEGEAKAEGGAEEEKPSPTKDVVAKADGVAPNAQSPATISEGEGAQQEQQPEGSSKTKSAKSEVSSPISLTKDHLPRPLSKVALSYRTNEWAKHLSHAETPELDELQMLDTPVEAPAPIDIVDLQRTALDGVPPPASVMKRSNSQMTSFSDIRTNYGGLSRQGTWKQPPSPPRGSLENQLRSPTSPGGTPFRSSSAPMRSSVIIQPIAEEQGQGLAINYDSTPESTSVRNSMTSPQLQAEGFQRSSPVPGVVSYANPQTLIGQRDMFLRTKSQGNLLMTMQDAGNNIQRPPSEVGSVSPHLGYAAGLETDPDDLPLNQRKQLMRNSSMMTLSASPSMVMQGPNGIEVSESAAFDSHQPKRTSQALSSAARQAQMANFRQSIAQELRSGTPLLPSSGRETPFASSTNLLSSREAEVQRSIETQRNMMLGQKEADAQRREMQRREKEWAEKVFDERMRSGDLLEAHREVMRKMQRKAKD